MLGLLKQVRPMNETVRGCQVRGQYQMALASDGHYAVKEPRASALR